jgi:hypothetical protein
VCHEKKDSGHDVYKEIATYRSATQAKNSEHQVEDAYKNCDLQHVNSKGEECVVVLLSDASNDRSIQRSRLPTKNHRLVCERIGTVPFSIYLKQILELHGIFAVPFYSYLRNK